MICAVASFNELKAQNLSGCGKTGTFIIYYQRNGNGSGLNFLLPRYDAPISNLTTNTAICPRFSNPTLVFPNTACCIGPTDCSNNFVYNFTNIPCDLDDYSPILLVSITAFSLVVLTKKTQKKISNSSKASS